MPGDIFLYDVAHLLMGNIGYSLHGLFNIKWYVQSGPVSNIQRVTVPGSICILVSDICVILSSNQSEVTHPNTQPIRGNLS